MRVVLNRHEAREAARVVVGPDRPLEEAARNQEYFESECRRIASIKMEVPQEASFLIGYGNDGLISGVTFQWWELEGNGAT